ncbi:MAG: hypothetical protein FJ397_10915 [Verrucomicrobia bacterium]|nr:hypothetical protein [Verrucomicrobiota bacterium]
MRRLLPALALAGALAAAEPFSRSLAPADFAAAGLGRLTPEELSRLDALIAARGAPPPAAPAAAAPAIASAPARVPAAPSRRPTVTAEEETVESRLTGEFRGWEPRTVFALENGQRWQETGGTTYAGPPLAAPAVRIRAGALGAYWMRIEGVGREVKVRRVDTGR